jgi:hypothetical protein
MEKKAEDCSVRLPKDVRFIPCATPWRRVPKSSAPLVGVLTLSVGMLAKSRELGRCMISQIQSSFPVLEIRTAARRRLTKLPRLTTMGR